MSDNVKKIKSYIEDILGAKGNLRDKLPTKKLKERDLFCEVLSNLQFVNSRTLSMKHDFKVNMMDYDDAFYVVVENLFKLHYTQEQRNLINWWLYEKFLPSGDALILTDTTTEKVIPSDTPEDIWDLVMEIKEKNAKKNPK